MACYVVNTSSEDDSGKKKCQPVLEDYYECLHHRKEVGQDRGNKSSARVVTLTTHSVIGTEDHRPPSRIPKTRSSHAQRRCTQRRSNTRSGTIGREQGGEKCKGCVVIARSRQQSPCRSKVASEQAIHECRARNVHGRIKEIRRHEPAPSSTIGSALNTFYAADCTPQHPNCDSTAHPSAFRAEYSQNRPSFLSERPLYPPQSRAR